MILDPRVRTKPYGRLFLDSLPDCRRVVERVERIARNHAAVATLTGGTALRRLTATGGDLD